MSQLFDSAIAIIFALQVLNNFFVRLNPLHIVGQGSTVKVTAKTYVVVVAHQVQHIIDVAIYIVDTSFVNILVQELSCVSDANHTVIFINGEYLFII